MDYSTFQFRKRGEHLQKRINELRGKLCQADPEILSTFTGIPFNRLDSGGDFIFLFGQQKLKLNFPELELLNVDSKKQPNPLIQALVFYYFHTADGHPLSYRWIAFSELPNGLFYNQAFQGYTGHILYKTFHNHIDHFINRANNLGGVAEPFGDVAFRFQILPRLPLLVAVWLGDDDFPPSYKILFDASIPHYLPTDACAIAGSMLTGLFTKD